METYAAVVKSPVGLLGVKNTEDKLTGIDFLSVNHKPLPPKVAFTKEVVSQLEHYFADPTFRFNLPIMLQGTPFQRVVWKQLRKIPSGVTAEYGKLAEKIKTSARAIGNACRRNPIPIIVPCHRVLARVGLGGFAGETEGELLAIKHWLLTHEGYDS